MKSILMKSIHGHVNVNGQMFSKLTWTLELHTGEPVASTKNSPRSFHVEEREKRYNLFA